MSQDQLWDAGPVRQISRSHKAGKYRPVVSQCAKPGCTNLRRIGVQGSRYCADHARSINYEIQNWQERKPREPLTERRGGLNKNGYRLIYLAPDDPLFEMTKGNGNDRSVTEHRLVMARHLGRPLASDEHVHHLNGNRDDNRIENLELWAGNHPKGQRVQDLYDWAIGIIERYAKEFGH